MSSNPKDTKPVVHIPVKNVNIHPAKGGKAEQYQPRDQIYVRKVEGFFQRLRQKMNFFFKKVLISTNCQIGKKEESVFIGNRMKKMVLENTMQRPL